MKLNTDEEFNSSALGEIAYQKLKAHMVNLTLRPGEALTELELIGTLRMSRTPIRQALHRLEQEGFVSLLPRKGWFINEISLKDIHEIFVVREALEGMAARIAAENITQGALLDLNLYVQGVNMESLEDPIDPGDELHFRILAVANNHRIKSVLGLYESHLQRFHQLTLRLPGRIKQSYQEHLDIVSAINNHDGDAAEAAMRKHIQSSRKSLFDTMAEGRVNW